MKLSYLVTCSTEKETLNTLLISLQDLLWSENEDELVILYDESATNNDYTKKILSFFDTTEFKMEPWSNKVRVIKHPLNADYGAHKNYGNTMCKGDWIFQIDGDENPSKELLSSIKEIIESNADVELVFVPRLNDFKGVTEEHAKQWGWKLTYNARPSLNDVTMGPLVNWPDYQGRVYKNDPSRIKWDRKLHEKIVGHLKYSFLPAEPEWALYHDKTIEKQIETNLRYNKVFTEADNKGHTVV